MKKGIVIMFGCLISFIVLIFSIILTFVILIFTGVSITLGLFLGLLAKILIPFILIGIGINLIIRKRS